ALVCGGVVRLEELADPFDLALVLRVSRAPFFVSPVCRYPQLGMLVHLSRANLYFDAFTAGTDHGGMDGAVEVAFGCRDVVVELPGNVVPQSMHDAECRV